MAAIEPINVLISLHKGYGVGDAVQMSSVLRHVQRYRPHWTVDYQAEDGKHQVARGLCRSHFAYDDPRPETHYNAEVQIRLYDVWANWHDRPNTRVSAALHDFFDIEWDSALGRYQVDPGPEVVQNAKAVLREVKHKAGLSGGMVAVHHRGDSTKAEKDLSHEQILPILARIRRLGRGPLLLDWRNQWKTECDDLRLVPSVGGKSFPQELGRRVDVNCAVISQCEAFIGIDSGPSKCAAATNVPSLVVWTAHHPAPFFDPAPNVVHLVPRGYHGLRPVCEDRSVIDWFEKHYVVRQYEADPVHEIDKWLKETLR